MNVTFRPMLTWPYPETRPRRSGYAFKAGWTNTLALLDREVRMLDGSSVVIGAGFPEKDLRLDGMLRSGGRNPIHPGVEISFDSRHGRLVYGTDACQRWEHNVRSIALGLEALRSVDRYGITRRGEQYAGWKALPRGDGPSPERGREIVSEHGSLRAALMATHPDQGGSSRDFADVQAYRESAPS